MEEAGCQASVTLEISVNTAFLSFSARQLTALFVMLGAIVGLGAYTFVYANGASYLSDSPAACANCHVMHTQYENWNKSAHKHVANCNDCHMPNNSFFTKYAAKSYNGLMHASAFTVGDYPDTLTITKFNRDVTSLNCVRCHEGVVSSMAKVGTADQADCLSCHRGVGH
jgi:cytochrome c nitrite reductase small subunit